MENRLNYIRWTSSALTIILFADAHPGASLSVKFRRTNVLDEEWYVFRPLKRENCPTQDLVAIDESLNLSLCVSDTPARRFVRPHSVKNVSDVGRSAASRLTSRRCHCVLAHCPKLLNATELRRVGRAPEPRPADSSEDLLPGRHQRTRVFLFQGLGCSNSDLRTRHTYDICNVSARAYGQTNACCAHTCVCVYVCNDAPPLALDIHA